MSSKHAVTLTCDKCGKTNTNDSSSHYKPGWIKVNIEVFECHSPPNPIYSANTRDVFDYCPDCVDKHGKNTLIFSAAEKID